MRAGLGSTRLGLPSEPVPVAAPMTRNACPALTPPTLRAALALALMAGAGSACLHAAPAQARTLFGLTLPHWAGLHPSGTPPYGLRAPKTSAAQRHWPGDCVVHPGLPVATQRGLSPARIDAALQASQALLESRAAGRRDCP